MTTHWTGRRAATAAAGCPESLTTRPRPHSHHQEPHMTTDPRALQLAQHRQRIGHESYGSTAHWDNLRPDEQQLFVEEAATWLRAAVEAGIAPAAERPTDEHDAVYVDDEGYLYAEYRTVPESDSVVRLVWAREQAESKRDLEEHGAQFRLIDWST